MVVASWFWLRNSTITQTLWNRSEFSIISILKGSKCMLCMNGPIRPTRGANRTARLFFLKLNLMILKKKNLNFRNQFSVAKYSIGNIQILFFLIFVFFYENNDLKVKKRSDSPHATLSRYKQNNFKINNIFVEWTKSFFYTLSMGNHEHIWWN